MYVPGSRALSIAALATLPIILAADAGSIALVKLSIPDVAAEAARAGVQAIAYEREASPEVAQVAYGAATSVADLHRQEVDRQTFTVYRDGGVQLTVRRTAPTMLLEHIPGLRGLAEATASHRAERANY